MIAQQCLHALGVGWDTGRICCILVCIYIRMSHGHKMPYLVLLCSLLPLFTCRNSVHLPYMDSPSLQPQYVMSYVTSRMLILDDQPHQQMTLHFQLSLQYNISPITGFIRLCHCCSLQFPSFHLCLFSPMCIYPVMTVLAYLLDDAKSTCTLDDALCVSHMT